MRRGVKARFTSLRIRSCIGGSIMIIDAGLVGDLAEVGAA